MKREILFKAKRVDNGEWVEGFYAAVDIPLFGGLRHFINKVKFEAIEVHPETVCQFTGLLDKNGNKIFEWDELSSEKHGNAFVVYDESVGMYGMKSEGSEAIDFDLWLYCKHAEITGNIHDK